MQPRLLSSTSITGTNVVNNLRENVGDIKDVMINLHDGTVDYVVLSVGGFLGLGDKLFAVPLEAFDIDTTNERFVLDVDKERLKNAPCFDKDNWPATSDTQFRDRMYNHYGVKRGQFRTTTSTQPSMS